MYALLVVYLPFNKWYLQFLFRWLDFWLYLLESWWIFEPFLKLPAVPIGMYSCCIVSLGHGFLILYLSIPSPELIGCCLKNKKANNLLICFSRRQLWKHYLAFKNHWPLFTGWPKKKFTLACCKLKITQIPLLTYIWWQNIHKLKGYTWEGLFFRVSALSCHNYFQTTSENVTGLFDIVFCHFGPISSNRLL